MTMHANIRFAGAFLLLSGVLASCGNGNSSTSPDSTDTTTSGTINISVDETFAPIITSQVDTFEKLYPSAHLQAAYKPEGDAIQDLLTDKARLAIVPRELSETERNVFKRINLEPRSIKIGTDGLAIILHPSNPDTLLTVAQLRDIFTGKTAEWTQVSGKKKLGTIRVVFDNNNSSTTRFVQDSVTRGAALTKQAFAAKSNPALLDYVATHPDAIGVVGVNWISDRDDATVEKFLERVNVAALSARASGSTPEDYVQPYQGNLAYKKPELLKAHPDLRNYPLRRDLYVISREARAGLGTGFASFAAGNNGQLIIQKSGLMPANVQVRLIETTTR
ncbi:MULTISPECIES: PstS family phosphate ABC transporter substrate-binding protein [Hymenobacter]|nr:MULTISPECIES: substrate-binding domain-containing protein [Hymenobacter]